MAGTHSIAAAFEHAVRLLDDHQPGAARYVFRQILAVVPGEPDVLHMLGVCDLWEDQAESAVDWIRQSLVGAPSDPVRYNNLAVALIRLQRFDEALEAVDQALALRADYPDALNNRGSALAELGRNEEALEAYAAAAALLADNAQILCNKGHVHLRLGQPREALECYTQALAIDPQHEQARIKLHLTSHLATLSYFDPESRYLAACEVDGASVEGLRSAIRQLNDGLMESAADVLEEVLARNPEWVEARAIAAVTEYRRHGFARGLEHWQAAWSDGLAPALRAILEEYGQRLASAQRLQALKDAVRPFDPAAVPPRESGDEVLHLVCSFPNRAGTELHCMDLAARLKGRIDVKVWSLSPGIHPSFQGQDIRLIDEARGDVPDKGTLAIIGAWHSVGEWFQDSRFRRIIVMYNVDDPQHLERAIRTLSQPGKPPVEIVYASDWMQRQTGLRGHFEPSPVDLEYFCPDPAGVNPERFVVGRLSRDVHYKFHPGAEGFFRTLARKGIPVRMMGATVLADGLGDEAGVELLPVDTEPTNAFLRSLDCFVYRTHCYFPEPWGRVVAEAMATGLPVVAHATGGFAQIIEHGRNGFLFHTDEEALAIVEALSVSVALRQRIGRAARETVEALYSEAAFDRYWQFYIS